jgi:exonuclease III
MKRYGWNILRISETHWKGQGDLVRDEVRMVYSGGQKCQRGVAILFDKEVSERISEIEKITDRLMMVIVSDEPVDIVLIQVYMPTTVHEDGEVEQIHKQIEDITGRQKSNENAE